MAAQRSEWRFVHEQRVGAVLEALGHAGQIVLWPACNSSRTGNVQRQVKRSAECTRAPLRPGIPSSSSQGFKQSAYTRSKT